MRIVRNTAIAVGLFITAMTMAGVPAIAGALPTHLALLKTASPAEVVQAAWGHRGWRWRHRGGGALLGGIATGVVLNPHPFRYGYCGYFPCPVYEPAYIPYAYYGAPYFDGYYVACGPWGGPYCGY